MAGRSSRLIFGACAIISGAAAMFGMNALPVMAVEDVGEKVAVTDCSAQINLAGSQKRTG